MADDPRFELRKAGDEYKAVRTSLAQVRAAIEPVIVEALRAGVPQKDVVELSGFTRETIRTMAATTASSRDDLGAAVPPGGRVMRAGSLKPTGHAARRQGLRLPPLPGPIRSQNLDDYEAVSQTRRAAAAGPG
ncbi:hypothetical protein [Pseudonocardia sp. D17]|uniref:hypothetical protein n=1 Tax=Pseudonocardia sp. D17 TaxID=882661 RepID=UPI0030CEEC8A